MLVDADVLGRRRTGDETYVANLLRELGRLAPDDLRLVAATRHPELVPDGVEPLELRAGSQELRMAVRMPLLLRRLRPDLAHFQHALPLHCPCPAVVTVHDLGFARDPALMPLPDRAVFKLTVPWGGAPRRPRPRRLGADEARPGRALRHAGGEDRRHPARRRPRLLPK